MKKNNFSNNLNINQDIVKTIMVKLFLIFLILFLYRIGSYIPVPGVDAKQFANLLSKAGGFFDFFNSVSGGSLSRVSIFALSLMPYITSSIIIQLFTFVFDSLKSLKEEGNLGRQKLNSYTKYLMIILSFIQSSAIITGLQKTVIDGIPIYNNEILSLKIASILTLVGGTSFLMWLGEFITSKKIVNGISLIIFVGIIVSLPDSIVQAFSLVRSKELTIFSFVFLISILIGLFYVVVYFERSIRNIEIHNAKTSMSLSKSLSNNRSYLPLKLNSAGVIPPIFASAILLFPTSILKFFNPESFLASWLGSNLVHGSNLFVLLYISLIIFFAFFYTSIVINSKDLADNLKKQNMYIAGIRPGEKTALFIEDTLSKITLIGSLYLAFVCAVPEFFVGKLSSLFALGGTSLLILVSVSNELITNIQTHLLSGLYSKKIMKKIFTR